MKMNKMIQKDQIGMNGNEDERLVGMQRNDIEHSFRDESSMNENDRENADDRS